MGNVAIQVENLGKLYRIGQTVGYKTLRESLTNAVVAPFRRLRSQLRSISREPSDTSHQLQATNHNQLALSQRTDYIWALKSISFEVKHGEVVGIIGRNGSGKSTLLKILSRITAPNEGYAEIHGRVGSLLEVGTGFHPELTGRENIYFNGAIMGLKKAEIERKFDEIVAFSEIEQFLDTPVKRYSSGMHVRLAFAVAAHLEPEILLVDEVLAVGDTAFQKKCLRKMEGVAREGRTVLLVSHNMATVQELCPRAILLIDGRIVEDNSARKVISGYLSSESRVSTGDTDVSHPSFREVSYSSPDSRFKWTRITLLNSKGQVSPTILFGEPFELALEGLALESLKGVRMGLGIHTVTGIVVFNAWGEDDNLPTSFPAGTVRFRVKIEPNFLAPEVYELHVGADGTQVQDVVSHFTFEVLTVPFSAQRVWKSNHHRGVVADPCIWTLDEVSPEGK